MKRRDALWTDPENTMLSEKSRHRRTHGVIPLMANIQNRFTDSGFLAVSGWEVAVRGWHFFPSDKLF